MGPWVTFNLVLVIPRNKYCLARCENHNAHFLCKNAIAQIWVKVNIDNAVNDRFCNTHHYTRTI